MKLSLRKLAGLIKLTQKSDRDFICVITGATGEGKSTLATHLHILVNLKFSFWNNVAYSKKEVIDKVKSLNNFSSLNVDEAINVLFRRDFMDKRQKELLRLFDMCRDKHLFVTLCLPWFWALDNHILQSGRIKLWIYVDKRGHAYGFMPDRNPFTKDAWHMKDNEKKLKRWSDMVHPEKVTNYVGDIVFDDLPEETKREYLEVKAKKKENAELYIEPKEKKREIKLLEQERQRVEARLLGELKDKGLLPRSSLKAYAKLKGENAYTLYGRVRRESVSVEGNDN